MCKTSGRSCVRRNILKGDSFICETSEISLLFIATHYNEFLFVYPSFIFVHAVNNIENGDYFYKRVLDSAAELFFGNYRSHILNLEDLILKKY